MDNNRHITQIFERGNTGNLLDEILFLSSTICPTVDRVLIRDIHNDIAAFFAGTHHFFQKNTLEYHNLRHTQTVALATTRLFHGLHCNNIFIDKNTLIKGLLSAYFHDTGLLLLKEDTAQHATEYIADHEERSILFLYRYCKLKNLDEDTLKGCATIIRYTNLALDPATFNFHSREIQLAGQVVGSADILAQMGDRYYLETLPILYRELKTDANCKYSSSLQLMKHTAKFYHNIVLERLMSTFSNTSQSMRIHFRERYKIDRNLYIENINKNIRYLKYIITECKAEISCMERHLKRTPPAS